MAAALVAACCLAQTAPADTAAKLRPAVGVRAADSSRKAHGRSAGLAMALSLVVPGGGQVYTGHYWKAALFAPAEVGLGYLALRRHNLAREALAAGDTTAYRAHRDWRTTWLFWTGTVVVFSMSDAYISAKMFGFNREMQFAGTGAASVGRSLKGRRVGLEFGATRAGLTMEF